MVGCGDLTFAIAVGSLSDGEAPSIGHLRRGSDGRVPLCFDGYFVRPGDRKERLVIALRSSFMP